MSLLEGILFLFAKRYIAGKTREEALRVARALSGAGIAATIDNLGENVTDEDTAMEAVSEYTALLDDIEKERLDCNISLKLTHLGLLISEERALENVETIARRAGELRNFVWFDMEGSAHTEKTIRIFLKTHGKYPDTGLAVQSCLKRSAVDISTLIKKGASARVVKGAYKEPPEVAFEDRKDVARNFSEIMKKLLASKTRPAIATHDMKLIGEAKRFAIENGIEKKDFEFQMLLGIKRTAQRELAREGYNMRVYVPYGKNWLPYALRRLRERKANIWFVIKNIFD
jgi:proline dehydrogenase